MFIAIQIDLRHGIHNDCVKAASDSRMNAERRKGSSRSFFKTCGEIFGISISAQPADLPDRDFRILQHGLCHLHFGLCYKFIKTDADPFFEQKTDIGRRIGKMICYRIKADVVESTVPDILDHTLNQFAIGAIGIRLIHERSDLSQITFHSTFHLNEAPIMTERRWLR